MSKKILSILLALVMVFAITPMSVLAEDNILDYLGYEINDGEVTITGCDTTISGDVVIPDIIDGYSVTTIGAYAFKDCYSQTSISIPDSVKEIGVGAFENCDNLESVVIGDGIQGLGDSVFSGCKKLKDVKIGKLPYIGHSMFYDCESMISVYIPDGTKMIKDYAFSGCKNLEIINIPDSVEYIGWHVFNDTSYYENEDNWEKGILYIGNHLISGKTDINNCDIREGTLTIAGQAFAQCEALESIVIPDSVVSIGAEAFALCCNLTSINLPDSAIKISDGAFYRTEFINNSENWENGMLYIGKHLVDVDKDIKECKIKDGIITIADGAFGFCEYFGDVTIPNGVILIGENAFAQCKIRNITISESVDIICCGAFLWCDSLVSVTIKNPTCSIYDISSTIPENTIIYGRLDSTAQAYAEKYSRTFIEMGCEHEYVSEVIFPTCTSQGYTIFTCNCGDTYVTDYVEAVGHNDENDDNHCDVCGKVISVDAPDTEIDSDSDDSLERGFIFFLNSIMEFFEKITEWFRTIFAVK